MRGVERLIRRTRRHDRAKSSRVSSAIAGLLSTTRGIVALSTSFRELEKDDAIRKTFSDLFRDFFAAIGYAVAVPEINDPVGKAVQVGVVATAHGLGVGFAFWGFIEACVAA